MDHPIGPDVVVNPTTTPAKTISTPRKPTTTLGKPEVVDHVHAWLFTPRQS
jgi:hypothetical protein